MVDDFTEPGADPALLDAAARSLRGRDRSALTAGLTEYAANALARLLEEIAIAERGDGVPEHLSGAAAEIALHVERHL